VGTRLIDATPPATLREWGDGPPVVFLHAMGPVSSGAMVGASVGPLVDAGFRVIAPDLPGYGDTPAPEPDAFDVARLASWLWEVVTTAGLHQIVLAGHSWGGAIACHMHAQSPEQVEALVLVDSGHLDYADVLGEDLALSLDDWMNRAAERRLRVADVPALAAALELPDDDPLLDLFLVGMEETGEGGLVSRVRPEAQGSALYHLARARQSDTWGTISAASTPTLLLLATEPDAARAQNERAARRFQSAVPGADVRFVPGATHSLVTDLRSEFGSIVAEWLVAGSGATR